MSYALAIRQREILYMVKSVAIAPFWLLTILYPVKNCGKNGKNDFAEVSKTLARYSSENNFVGL